MEASRSACVSFAVSTIAATAACNFTATAGLTFTSLCVMYEVRASHHVGSTHHQLRHA